HQLLQIGAKLGCQTTWSFSERRPPIGPVAYSLRPRIGGRPPAPRRNGRVSKATGYRPRGSISPWIIRSPAAQTEPERASINEKDEERGMEGSLDPRNRQPSR